MNVYLTLKKSFGGPGPVGSGDQHGVAGRVGIISPYAKQISVLKQKFEVGGREVLFVSCLKWFGHD